MTLNKIFFIAMLVLLSTSRLFAQQPKDTLHTEIIEVVKPYVPTISDAFKVKESPSITEEVIEKDSVAYHINSVPVASTFTPAKGKAKGVTRPKKERLYDNFLSVGFGNYTSPLLDAYIRTFPDRDSEVGAILQHHSSQGGIKDVLLKDAYYNTDASIYYKREDRDRDWIINLDLGHNVYNWYGLPSFTTFSDGYLDEIDPSHSYYNIGINGTLKNMDQFFEGGKLSLNYFGDNYKSQEQNVRIEPTFGLPISSELINFQIDLNYLNGIMSREYAVNNEIKYSYFSAGIIPNFEVLRDHLSINLGVKLYYLSDLEHSKSSFKAYPNVDASYELVEEIFTLFGGATGGHTLNTYATHTDKNPYLSPNFRSIPTDEKYQFYAGLKGKLTTNMNYLFKGSYSQVEKVALYQQNTTLTDGNITVEQPYQLGNSFGVIYDDANILKFQGELAIDFTKEFTLSGRVDYHIYDFKNELEPWNLPALQTSIAADYHADKWRVSAKLYMMSDRKDLEYPDAATSLALDKTPYVVKNGTYIDLNATLSYTFTERLSAFGKVQNLLTTNYERYQNYPVQGLQILGGITYKFDF